MVYGRSPKIPFWLSPTYPLLVNSHVSEGYLPTVVSSFPFLYKKHLQMVILCWIQKSHPSPSSYAVHSYGGWLRNPAPVEKTVVFTSLFIGFQPSQVQDFATIHAASRCEKTWRHTATERGRYGGSQLRGGQSRLVHSISGWIKMDKSLWLQL